MGAERGSAILLHAAIALPGMSWWMRMLGSFRARAYR